MEGVADWICFILHLCLYEFSRRGNWMLPRRFMMLATLIKHFYATFSLFLLCKQLPNTCQCWPKQKCFESLCTPSGGKEWGWASQLLLTRWRLAWRTAQMWDILLVTDFYQWACKTCKVNNSNKMRKCKSAKLKQNLQATLLITALDACVVVMCYFSRTMNFAGTGWSSGPLQKHHFPTPTPGLTIVCANSYSFKPFSLCRMYWR